MLKRTARAIFNKIYVLGLNRHFKHPHCVNNSSKNGEIRINIGAGPEFKLNKWTNTDITTEAYYHGKQSKHIEFDIRSEAKLPFDDNTVSDVYISHVIEHVENNHTQKLFRDVYRVLKSKGVFRIACPNADLFYYSINMDTDPNRWRDSWFKARGLPSASKLSLLIREIATGFLNESFKQEITAELNTNYQKMSKCEFLDYICSKVSFSYDTPGNHLNWYDYDKIERMLNSSGFDVVFPSSFGTSISEEMRVMPFFDHTEPQMSLYVEAVKS